MKDESKRDDAIAKLASEKLRARAASPGAACPEAEILAAYVERTLAPKERTRWEEHFAACARCQESIAQLVRLSEADEPAGAQALRPARARRFPALRWAWAAPMLLVLLVAGLWYTGEFKETIKPGSETAVQSPAPPVPAAEKQQPAEQATGEKAASPAQTQKARAETAMNVRRERAPQQASIPRAPAANAPAREVPSPAKNAIAAGGEISRPREEMAGAASQPSPSPEARFQAAPPAATDQLAEQSQGAMMTLQKRAPQALGRQSEAGAAAQETAAKARPMTALSENLVRGQAASGFHYASVAPGAEGKLARKSVAGPWRVGPRGLIQKEDPNGNWITQPSGVTTDLLAAAFPNSEAGWVVGKAGTILRTTDGGNTWQKVSSPTDEDVVSVAATSADSAKVSTRSGQSYSTSDGGKTWKVTPGLQ